MDFYQNLSPNVIVSFVGFAILAIASRQIGKYFTWAKLPLITGYLFSGILAGPYLLNLIGFESSSKLDFINDIALAFIAFAAGGELYLNELKNRISSIKWVTLGLTVSTLTLGSLTIFWLADYIPFMKDLPHTGRLAIAILGAAILVARSPSSAIAVIKELRARGKFTQTVLGVTVLMDVVVIILFSINHAIAQALLEHFDFGFNSILWLGVELGLSLIFAYLLKTIILGFLSIFTHQWLKSFAVLVTGFGVFVLSEHVSLFTQTQFALSLEFEPLLVCMVAGFLLANYSPARDEFLKILDDMGISVYVMFFTLAGATLKLDVLTDVWLITLILFGARIVCLFVGSFLGGTLAGDPRRNNQLGWMAYITQAGVGLGLAQKISVEYSGWGPGFATMIISIIVLNQIVGPAFFKWALFMVREAHPRAKKSEPDLIHRVIIFGGSAQAMALAKQLNLHDWEVTVVHKNSLDNQKLGSSKILTEQVSSFTVPELATCGVNEAGAIVTMLSDEENLRICEWTYENCGATNLVVLLNENRNYEVFQKVGAFIVSPSTAIISLLDHFVRSPSVVSLLFGLEEGHDIVDLEVRNPNLDGLAIKHLRLPPDSLILSIHRRGHLLNAHGYTRLKLHDQVTVTGSNENLEVLSLRFEG